jgi:hypothetical protein
MVKKEAMEMDTARNNLAKKAKYADNKLKYTYSLSTELKDLTQLSFKIKNNNYQNI